MDNFGIIYKVTNKINGKIYIGHSSKKYVITDPMNNVFVVHGLRYFCKNCGSNLTSSAMCLCASGKRNQHKGYLCRYFNELTDKYLPMWEAN